jgi:hypothetical protein
MRRVLDYLYPIRFVELRGKSVVQLHNVSADGRCCEGSGRFGYAGRRELLAGCVVHNVWPTAGRSALGWDFVALSAEREVKCKSRRVRLHDSSSPLSKKCCSLQFWHCISITAMDLVHICSYNFLVPMLVHNTHLLAGSPSDIYMLYDIQRYPNVS